MKAKVAFITLAWPYLLSCVSFASAKVASDASDCGSNCRNPYVECIDSNCRCKAEFPIEVEDNVCLAYVKSLGDACWVSEQCSKIVNSLCIRPSSGRVLNQVLQNMWLAHLSTNASARFVPGQCVCSQEYFEAFDPSGSLKCSPRKIGSPCKTSYECAIKRRFTTCGKDKKCTCIDGFTYSGQSDECIDTLHDCPGTSNSPACLVKGDISKKTFAGTISESVCYGFGVCTLFIISVAVISCIFKSLDSERLNEFGFSYQFIDSAIQRLEPFTVLAMEGDDGSKFDEISNEQTDLPDYEDVISSGEESVGPIRGMNKPPTYDEAVARGTPWRWYSCWHLLSFLPNWLMDCFLCEWFFVLVLFINKRLLVLSVSCVCHLLFALVECEVSELVSATCHGWMKGWAFVSLNKWTVAMELKDEHF